MNDSKRQNLPDGLWVVATPIGNLGDLSQRVVEAIRQAELIFCEDTRRTSVLLSALGLFQSVSGTPRESPRLRLVRLDAHSSLKSIQEWVERLAQGGRYALVTDAGTPGISDPGALLVAEAQKRGIRVTPVPGPSAVIALLSVSGFQESSFTFRGYFPRKLSEQEKELKKAALAWGSRIYVWFESPLRIRKALLTLKERFPQVQVVAGKELTKIYEQIITGTAVEVCDAVSRLLDDRGEIGEWCFAVQFPDSSKASEAGFLSDEGRSHGLEDESSLAWLKALTCLLNAGIKVLEASKQVSQVFGISKKIAYRAALDLQSQKKSEGT